MRSPEEEVERAEKALEENLKNKLPYEDYILKALEHLSDLESHVWSVNCELTTTNKELQSIKEAIWAITER